MYGRYIRMHCIAPLRQTQLASSTRGLINIASRRSRHSLKLTVPGARSCVELDQTPCSLGAVSLKLETAESPAQPRGARGVRITFVSSYVSMPAAWCRFRVGLLHAAAPVVCCILCVASVPCCALVVEDNASRMLLLVRCALLVRCSSRTKVSGAVCFPLQLACARILLHIVCCLLHVVWCMRAWVCRLLRGVCRMPHVALLPCCLGACRQWSFPKFHVVCCMCMLHVASCPLQ